jgi:hypothetical protein
VDLLLLLDSSESMTAPVAGGTRSKGELVSEALTSFIKDPRSAGLGVGLRFFPGLKAPTMLAGSTCQSDTQCDSAWTCRPYRVCQTPIIGPCLADVFGTSRQCLGSEACVPAGRCSRSKFPCYPVGQLCDETPGDLCETAAPICQPPPPEEGCQPSRYENLAVPIAALPGAEAPLSQALKDAAYWGGTPMGPAIEGALAHARKHQAASPTHRVALVLATDGLPGDCEPRDASGLSALVASELMGTPPIATYAIGVFADKEMAQGGALLESVALSGGTGKPFVLNSDPTLARTFQDALEKIRQETAVPCAFMIPPLSTPIDYGKVNVSLQDAASSREDIPHVSSSDRCDPSKGGWFYDIDPSMGPPTRVLTCPATCDRLKSDPTAKVSLVFGCKTRAID